MTRPNRKHLDPAYLTAGFMILLYIITFAHLALLRHASFNSSGFDLGIYDQVTWNTLHGRFLFYTTTGQPLSHLSNHASPIMLLVAPLYLIHSGPETLLILQPLVIGLGGWPLFWLARQKLANDVAALSLLLGYLLFPTLQIVNLWDFHPPVLAVGLVMAAFYCLETHRRGWFLLLTILIMACKEHLPLMVAFMGLYTLFRHRDWQLGLTTIALAGAWFFSVMYWVIPAHSVSGDHIFIGYYADLGDSAGEIVLTALTRPDLVINNLWQPAKLAYLFAIFTPFAYLPLLGLPVLLIGTPMFAINLLSANPAMHDATGAQYGADVAPWLAWASLYGLVTVRQMVQQSNWLQQRLSEQTVITGLSGLLIITALIWQLFRGYSPLALNPPHWTITDHDRLADRFIAQIPPDAPLSAQGKLYPHLSNRLIAYQLPDVHEADYIFLDVTRGTWPIHPADLRSLTLDLLRSGEFGVLDAAEGYLLLKRGQPQTPLPAEFYDFARVETANPAYPLTVEFGDHLRLLGYDILDNTYPEDYSYLEKTAVRLYWQTRRPIDQELRLYPFFTNAQGEVIETTDLRPMLTQLWYPPSAWQPGEIIITETIPWTLGDQWSLAVGVLAGESWADWSHRLPVRIVDSPTPLRRFEANTWVRLGTFQRQGRQLVPISPGEADQQPPHPLTANFSDYLALRGYETALNDESLTVTLYWQALSEMDRDYSVFVHVVNSQGETVAQHDGQPWWEAPLPTSSWQPGEQLRDRHQLTLPADLPSGSYQLRVGVYYWETLARLEVQQPGQPVQDFVALDRLTVP